ncbi:MAG: ADP-ribosylation factor-like protein [Candidatus Hodarchaeota archaeon]
MEVVKEKIERSNRTSALRAKKGLKILLTGPYHGGKSTCVHSLGDNAISLDQFASDGTTTTVAFDLITTYWVKGTDRNYLVPKKDLAKTELDQEEVYLVQVYGTPGQLHFASVRATLAVGCDGVIFVIDSVDAGQLGEFYTFYYEMKSLLEENVPMIILANKQDLENALSKDEIDELLQLDLEIFESSALLGQGVKEALIYLLEKVLDGC